MNWYEINNIEDFDSPALVVYPERVEQNISACIKMVGDLDRLRPHVKTNKTVEVVQMMLAQGIAKFKCATIAEAEMLAITCRRRYNAVYDAPLYALSLEGDSTPRSLTGLSPSLSQQYGE